MKLPTITAASDFARHFQDDVWRRVAKIICQRHQLSCSDLRRCEYGENIIFFVDARFVVKIFAPFRQSFQRERAALEFADGKLAIETPQIVHAGEFEGWSYIVMTQLAGVLAGDVWVSLEEREQSEIVSRLGASMSELHAHAAPLAEVALNRGWQTFIERQARTCVERQRDCGASHEWLESLPAFLDARMELLPADYQPVLLHGDIHLGNLLLAQSGGGWRISGLFDFGDSLCGFHEYEFVAPGVLMVQGKREMQRALLLAYGYREAQIDLNLRARLMLLTVLYECSDLRKYALRLAPEAVLLTLDELEAALWTFA